MSTCKAKLPTLMAAHDNELPVGGHMAWSSSRQLAPLLREL